MGAAVGSEIGAAAGQVDIVDLEKLIDDLETNGTNALHLNVSHLDAEGLQLSDGLQIARRAQGAADVKRTFEGRVAGDCSRRVNAQQRSDIEMMKGEVQIGAKVMLHGNVARDRQVSFIEIGMSLEIELPARGDGVEIEIAGAFFVER